MEGKGGRIATTKGGMKGCASWRRTYEKQTREKVRMRRVTRDSIWWQGKEQRDEGRGEKSNSG